MTHAIPNIKPDAATSAIDIKYQVVLHFNDGTNITYLEIKNPSKFIHLAEVRFAYMITGRTLESATVIPNIYQS